MYVVVVQKFTFAISFSDEFLVDKFTNKNKLAPFYGPRCRNRKQRQAVAAEPAGWPAFLNFKMRRGREGGKGDDMLTF